MVFSRAACLLSLFILAGCGGASRLPLGYVAGVVTYKGNPVENINVLMKPEPGRTAYGRTDANGKYEIEYIAGEKGTKVGPTIVSLEWPLGTDPPSLLSRKYSSMKSTLTLDVKPGRNSNFDISIQPDPQGEKKAAKKVEIHRRLSFRDEQAFAVSTSVVTKDSIVDSVSV